MARNRRSNQGRPAALAHPRQLTPRWLTAVLRRAGIRAEAAGFRWRRIGADTGIGGFVTRVELRYASPHPMDAPATLVVKFPRDPSWIDAAIVEQRFYQKHAADCPFGTPRCYLAAVNRRARRWTLVLEDLSGHRALDDILGIEPHDAEVIVDSLAAMHAWGWRRDTSAWLDPPGTDWLSEYYEAYHERGLRRLRGFVPREHLAQFRGLEEAARVGWSVLASEPLTVLHGDFRGDNLFMPRQGPPIAIDWESAHRMRGGHELGRFLITSLRTPDLRRDGNSLIATYAAGLARRGVTAYARSQIERDVRLGMLRHTIQSVAQMHESNLGRGRPLRVVRTWAIRGHAAVRHFDALAAVGA
jgi:hypothetical protein